MQTDIHLNQRPFYYISIVIITFATVVPVYLSFHFSKVGFIRFLVLTLISYAIAGTYIFAEWLFFQKLKRALILPLVDGTIVATVDERWTRNGTLSKCIVELNYRGKNLRIVPKEEFRSVMVGAMVRVLFDEKSPQDSVYLRENRYLKITRSTLKDN